MDTNTYSPEVAATLARCTAQGIARLQLEQWSRGFALRLERRSPANVDVTPVLERRRTVVAS